LSKFLATWLSCLRQTFPGTIDGFPVHLSKTSEQAYQQNLERFYVPMLKHNLSLAKTDG